MMTDDRPATVVVTATFTAEPVAAMLRQWGRWLGASWVIREAGYNQVLQELLDESSASRTNDGVNVVLVRPADLGRSLLGEVVPAGQSIAFVRELATALAVAATRSKAGWLVAITPSGPTMTAEDVEAVKAVRAAVAGCASVRVESGGELADDFRVTELYDGEGDRLGHLPHPPEFLAVLAAVAARHVHSRSARPAKVVAVDADHTLWRGVVGEVGVAGLVVDAPCLALQNRLRSVRERGALLAVVSKNDPKDVEAALRDHPEMKVRPEDFVAVRASWEPKSHALRALAAELDLGLDSFLFLDDNPVEVAEVRAHAPEVLSLQIPAPTLDGAEAEAAMERFLSHVWALDPARSATAEDAARTDMYRAQAERAEALREAPSFEDFLQSLQLQVDIAPATPADVPRLAQLTQRTNQFNAVGLRRTEEALTEDLETGMSAVTVSARDRFGDYGLVGLIAYRAHGHGLEVEHFLLSCRALGKRIEHRMIEALYSAAAQRHATHILLPLTPTERNEPVATFLRTHFGEFERQGVFHIPRGTSCRSTPAASPAADQTPATRPRSGLQGPDVTGEVWQRIASELTTGRSLLAALQAEAHRSRPAHLPSAYRPAATGHERAVVSRFEEILAVSPVGADDSFVDLGGQSVQAAQILARLSRDIHCRLPLRALFDHPTPASLAAHLATLAPTTAAPLVARPRDQAAYPLSASQRRMWFLDRYAPGNAAYHIVTAHHLTGPLDLDALRQALASLSLRHESLRARFPDIDGHPTQVFDGPGLELSIHDRRHLPPDTDPPSREITPPAVAFDLARGPLARIDLTLLPNDEALAVLSLHHIIADGWSLGVLWRDLASILRGQAMRPLRLQPLDLAAHQDALQAAGAFENDLAYWRQALRQPPEALNLPTDFPRPAERSFEGAIVQAELPASLVASLESTARRHGTTLFTAVMAGFHALLHRWSGQDDILIGTPVSGRTESASEDMIGCLINTVVIRSHPEATRPFDSLLDSLRDSVLSAFSHQDLPFERLVEALDIPRNRALSPLFQVMLVLQNTPPASLALPGVTSRQLAVHNGTAKFDLVLEISPQADGSAALTLEYATSLFRRESAAQLLSSFQTLLAHAAAEPTTPIGNLRLLTDDERQRLLTPPDRPHQPPPPAATVHQWFEQTAARFPHRPAVNCDQSVWTYDALNRRANRIAHRLRAAGVTPGTPVAVCLERSLDLVAALLGILKSGGAYLPIDLSYPPDRLAFMLEDAAAPVFLTQRVLAEKLPPHRALVLSLDDSSTGLQDQPEDNPPATAGADDLIYIIYTSGSTGRPKGCCLTHRNVTRLFSATAPWFHFNEHDVWTLFHSYAFDFSVWELWGALLYGGRLVVVPYLVSRSPEDFHSLLVREEVTVLNQTPSAFRQLIAVDAATGPPGNAANRLRLRTVVFGGEALEMQSLQPWFARHGDTVPQLVNMYGITETTVHVTYRPLSSRDVAGGSVIGEPIPDLRLYILDPHQQPCPTGVPGELFVGGAGVARGYLNRDELTAQRFLPSPFVPGDRLYRTGDLARLLPDGDVEYLGRIDRQVKIRGFRIELGEIESALLTHPSIREAAVLARDGLSGRQLVAYFVPQGDSPNAAGSAPTSDDLRLHLRRTLPDYMVPAAWVPLREFPLTPNGKLDTAALPAPESERAPTVITEAPATPTEKSLAAIWCTVLRLDRVGRHDNFFAVGGDSILSIQVISQARLAGWPLAPRHLFEHQTIAELAACADSLAPTARAEISEGPATGTVPLTPIQRWFLRQNLADPHWWNQAFLLDLQRPVSAAAFGHALTTVLQHHDAFRLRCARPTTGPAETAIQRYADSPGPAHFEYLTDGADLPAAMARAHRALNMETGPLLGAVLTPSRLFLVAHHMSVDGVSWRVLLEDLESALDGRALPSPVSSYQAWARALEEQSDAFATDLPYWEKFLAPHPPALPPDAGTLLENIEDSVIVETAELTAGETTALLTTLPLRTRARIDEILLTALCLALHDLTTQTVIRLHTEGHGREAVITDVDTARLVGWFTALYPVEIVLPPAPTASTALRAAKEHLRAMPNRGLGWGVLGLAARAATTPDVVFNYLGQFDGLVAGSSRFTLSSEPSPPWHGPTNRRAHAVEIDAFVRDGRLRAEFRLSRSLHRPATARALANAFATKLGELLRVESALAPSDFPLVRLTQPQVDGLGPIDDVWPLSPMQELLAGAAAVKGGAALDQWHCRLHGPLDTAQFRRAWDRVLLRHPLLRATLLPLTGETLGAVIHHPDRSPLATWRVEDWRGRQSADLESSLAALRLEDHRRRTDPTTSPLLRFTLVRLAEAEHFFLWSAPDWMLDGWSWPIVFRELSAFYANDRAALPPARPYRDYLAWLARRDAAEDADFWRATLAGFRTPTPLPIDKPEAPPGSRRHTARVVPLASWNALTQAARTHAVPPTAVLMAAWAALLARAAGQEDIVFGAAFSGRPAELPGIEGMVGPCTTNLPLRQRVDPGATLDSLATAARDALFAAGSHQHVSPLEVQDWSAVPWRDRLFDSLVVFQNYEVTEAARSLGGQIRFDEFDGPVHGSYTLILVATPQPDGLHLELHFPSGRCSEARAAAILAVLASTLQGDGSQPLPAEGFAPLCQDSPVQSSTTAAARSPVPPRTPLERAIHGVWARAFGPEVGVDENFFEAGGHSLLAFRVLAALRVELGLALTPADLFQFPTIASLARKFAEPADPAHRPISASSPPLSPAAALDAVKARAARARQALGQR